MPKNDKEQPPPGGGWTYRPKLIGGDAEAMRALYRKILGTSLIAMAPEPENDEPSGDPPGEETSSP